MKKYLSIVLAVVASFTSGLAAKEPIQKARHDLERAHSMLTAQSEGGKGGIGKNKATLPNIVAALSDAEVSLNGANNNKGTNLNVALKFIAEAKAELEAAKGGGDEHLDKAQKAIEEALKRVMQGIKHKK